MKANIKASFDLLKKYFTNILVQTIVKIDNFHNLAVYESQKLPITGSPRLLVRIVTNKHCCFSEIVSRMEVNTERMSQLSFCPIFEL